MQPSSAHSLTTNPEGYRGRFAPSPTGPLHFGSIIAAVGSCLEARRSGGEWLVRMEDVDEPRCRPEAAADILRTLEAFGFEWDGTVLTQSRRKERYREALGQLTAAGLVFPCACTRRELAEASLIAVDGGQRYPGTCRAGLPPGRSPRAWRLRVDEHLVEFDDRIQGKITQQLAREVGDFILLRADGFFAYQLAVVVDDLDQGVTHVVRGADLLDSTPRQIRLFQHLGGGVPVFAHVPVAVNAAGEKLSKQTLAAPVQACRAAATLVAALHFLGQAAPVALVSAEPRDVWDWAFNHWDLTRVPRHRALPLPQELGG